MTAKQAPDRMSGTGGDNMYQVKRGSVQWQVKPEFSVEVDAEVTFEFTAPYPDLIKRLIQVKIVRAWHIHYESRNLVDLSEEERKQALEACRHEAWEWTC